MAKVPSLTYAPWQKTELRRLLKLRDRNEVDYEDGVILNRAGFRGGQVTIEECLAVFDEADRKAAAAEKRYQEVQREAAGGEGGTVLS